MMTEYAPTNDLDEVMRTAATVRYYTDEAVDETILMRVLERARFAPNGGNRQAWRVIAVTDPEIRRRLRDLYLEPWLRYTRARRVDSPTTARRSSAANEFAKRLDRVPVHLVVCAHLPSLMLTDDHLERPSIVGGASVYPFVQNLLLGCRAEGLGAALTTILCRSEGAARELLAIPEDHAIACLLAVGHPDPARIPRAKRAAVETFLSRDRFDQPF